MTTFEQARPTDDREYQFFDPKQPELPEEVFGLNTEAVFRLGEAAVDAGFIPYAVGSRALPSAVRILPLIEEMQEHALQPEDVRPYRKSIKDLSPKLKLADRTIAAFGAVPLRRSLNRRIEREFPTRASETLANAREVIASLEGDVEHLASFTNPKEQFIQEVESVAETTRTAIFNHRNQRIAQEVPDPEPEAPRGFLGFVTKVARKVRSFFGIFSRKPMINPEVTAYDAGAGIAETLDGLTEDPNVTREKLPLLSKLVLDRMPKVSILDKDKIAIAAPELLQFIFSLAPENTDNNELLHSVHRNPHELRFAAKFVHYATIHNKTYSIDGFRRAARTLLPAIRDVLPTNNTQVRATYDRVQRLTMVNEATIEQASNTQPEHNQQETNVQKRRFQWIRRLVPRKTKR